MKNVTILPIVLLSALSLSACSTNRAERYKKLKADSIILCGGSLEGINYQDGPYNTVISCDGKTFRFSKIPRRGLLAVFN